LRLLVALRLRDLRRRGLPDGRCASPDRIELVDIELADICDAFKERSMLCWTIDILSHDIVSHYILSHHRDRTRCVWRIACWFRARPTYCFAV